jgi:hypothetical protein
MRKLLPNHLNYSVGGARSRVGGPPSWAVSPNLHRLGNDGRRRGIIDWRSSLSAERDSLINVVQWLMGGMDHFGVCGLVEPARAKKSPYCRYAAMICIQFPDRTRALRCEAYSKPAPVQHRVGRL